MAAAQDRVAEDAAALGEDLQNVIDHAAALLDALSDEGDARLGALRERVTASIDSARAHLQEMRSDADRPSERAAAALERWIRDNPWMVVAMGASVGLAAGLLLARRRTRHRERRPDAGAPAPATSTPDSR